MSDRILSYGAVEQERDAALSENQRLREELDEAERIIAYCDGCNLCTAYRELGDDASER